MLPSKHFRIRLAIINTLVSLLNFTSANNYSPTQVQCQNTNKNVDIDSVSLYPKLNFQPSWARDKHFWKSKDFDFESRYLKSYSHESVRAALLPCVEVLLLPFSHTDPGWKFTYEGYYYSHTKRILNNIVTKLTLHKNMTFAWTEISFLSKWWDEASSSQKETLKKLVHDGRLEILTGGWVMADEATTSLFALVNQLTEGLHWVHTHLNFQPTSAWSLDAFGHASTMPYLLRKSGISGMMIQRIHFAYKHWFAENRKSDFLWMPRWSSDKEDGIVCHNAHYDLYPTKHACGPHPNTCLKFDFRKMPDAKEENLIHMKEVNNRNLQTLAEDLVGQYRRTASLTVHNKVVTILGGDFRFEEGLEFDQQYENYGKLFNFMNQHKHRYHTSVKFGTLSEYFKGLQSANMSFPIFKGDFFPYSDIIFPFSPAYWTGFYGTRPFWKKLSREAEDELLKAELLFTFAYNLMRQRGQSSYSLYRNYDNLVYARRAVALFQHHDGITATSPRSTMLDYARKLTKAWNFSRYIQKLAIETIWRNELNITVPPLKMEKYRIDHTKTAEDVPVKLYASTYIVKKIIIFNSLGWKRSQLVRLQVEEPNVGVRGPQGESVVAQVNPVPDNANGFELIFVAQLPAGVSLVTYEIFRSNDASSSTTIPAQVKCRNCDKNLDLENIEEDEIIVDNGKVELHFDSKLGTLNKMRNTQVYKHELKVNVSFGRYDSGIGSGAYLLRPYVSSEHPLFEEPVNETTVYFFEGPVISEVILISEKIKLSSWIVHTGSVEIQSVIFMRNVMNGSIENFGEYFMRLKTDINNNEATRTSSGEKQLPVFFTDSNGHSVEKRINLNGLPYQVNHYPVTNYAFIQDPHKKLRLSLAVDRTHGISSPKGQIELLYQRRAKYDDARGMDEPVMDRETTVSNYALKLESFAQEGDKNNFKNWEASLGLQRQSRFLNHEPSIFIYDALAQSRNGQISLFSNEFPEDVHLLNLRTLSRPLSGARMSVPRHQAILTLQRFGNREVAHEQCSDPSGLPKLKTSMVLSHSARETNLVGTKVFPLKSNFSRGGDIISNLNVGKPYELKSYLVQF